jgi:hypothetical protein
MKGVFAKPASRLAKRLLPSFVWEMSEWPACDDTKLFLAAVIPLVGQALYAERWTGEEIEALSKRDHPDLARDAATRAAEKAAEYSKIKPAGEVGTRSVEGVSAPLSLAQLSPEEMARRWIDRRPAEIAKYEREGEVRDRLLSAISWLTHRFRNELVRSYRRKKAGGPPTKIDQTFWFREKLVETVFWGCNATWGGDDYWIFVERSDLEAELKKIGATGFTGTDVSRFSPVLQFAVWFAQAFDLTGPGKHDTKDRTRADIIKHWRERFGAAPTQPQLNAIYTAVRFPDQDAIQSGQRGGRRPKNG